MTAQRSKRAVRGLQIGFLVLLVVCTAQLVYWMADEWRYTASVRAHRLDEYETQVRSSAELLRTGVKWSQIAASHPAVELGADSVPRVSVAARARLDADRFHRLNRYAWEGAFFLAVLIGAMAVVYAALRRENLLRREQDEFLAAASHELRSPLASLKLSAESLAMRDPPPPRRAELVQRLLADLGRLEQMITNVLEASRLSGNVGRASQERIELAPLVMSVVDELRPLAHDSGVTVRVDVPSAVSVNADMDGVRTIVRNLVHNGIKASRVAGGDVTVRATQDTRGVTMLVEDTGVGFAPKESSRLFEKFYRVEPNGRERAPGTGLGLFLVRRYAEMDGGTVSAFSEGPDRGARFSVHWPLANTDSQHS